MKEPYGVTIFCDDVRDELFNKKTLVGVYSGELLVGGDFPALLPTFGIMINYIEPLEMPVSPVTIKVLIPDENGEETVLLDMDIPDDRPQFPGQNENLRAEFRSHTLAFRVSPLVIQCEGYIKVRAYVDGKEIRLGALNIRRPNELEKSEPPFSKA